MNRVFQIVVLSLVACPLVAIALAMLFHSDTLGWVFGLSLVAAAILLPCVVLLWLVAQWIPHSRRAKAKATAEAELPGIPVRVDRDAVHASDESQARQIAVSPAATLRSLIERALADARLPAISGGRATWVVEASHAGEGLVPIAVCAQQWMEPAFLVSPHTPIGEQLGRTGSARVMFRYRCQDDPQALFRSLAERPALS